MTQKHQHYHMRVVLTLVWLFLSGAAFAAEEVNPEDIIEKSIGMLNDDCDFACCYEVAGVYTQRYLTVTREAIIASLEANPNVNTIIRQGFGGKATNLADVEAFAPRELFAWHLCDTIMQIPAKYRYSKLEIIDTRHISPDTIAYVVRLSGVQIAPNTKEEAFYRLVRENGQWRIDQ